MMLSRRGMFCGFTLVEVIIVAALFVILGAVLLVLLMGGQTSYLVADTYLQVQQEARKALDTFGREMREAVNVTCGSAAVTADCTSLSTDPARINFQLLQYNAGDGTVTLAGTVGVDDHVHYLLLGTDLVRYRDGAATAANLAPPCTAANNCRMIAHNIQSVSFTWDNKHDDGPNGTGTATIQLEALIRNAFLPGGSSDAGALRTGPLRSQVELRTRWPQP